MRQNAITLAACAVLVLGAIAPTRAQMPTATARLVPGQSGLVSINSSPLATRFDGRRVNAALAREVAGNRELFGWANCAGQLRSDGTIVYPDARTRRRMGSDVACLYIATGEPDDFQEYFITDGECDQNASRANACLAGYAVDTRVRNRITSSTKDRQLNVTIERTMFFAALAAGQLPSGGVDTSRRTRTSANAPLALRMDRVGSTRCELTFTVLTRRSSCQAFNANGNALGTPVVNEGYDYVAYNNLTTDMTGATNCQQLRSFAEANALANNETAKELLDWYQGIGATGGGLVGYIIGRGAGDRVGLGAEASKAGAVIGGALGYYSVSPSQLAVEYIGPIQAAVIGAVVEAKCEEEGLFDQPGPTPDDPGLTNPGRAGGNVSAATDQMCFTCTRVLETTMTAYDNDDGNVVEVQVVTICIEHGWVPC